MTSATANPPGRPRDRKARITTAAMELFHRSGYDATSMEDIAASVGITAGALYRHFRSKQEILGQSLLPALDLLAEVSREPRDLDALLRVLATFSLDHRPHIGVWARQTRSLSREHRAAVREYNAVIVAGVATALCTTRPELSHDDAQLLGWAVLDVFASPAFHRTDLPRHRFESLLCAQATALCQTPAPLPNGSEDAEVLNQTSGINPASRRQALVNAAVPLFREHGFQSVSMEDIGAAAGISGRSIYQHFAGKAELLGAAMNYAAGALMHKLFDTLADSRTPAQALGRVLEGYAASSIRLGSVEVWAAEMSHLSDADREALLQTQSEYVAEWVALLIACRPALDQAEARMTVHSALTVVNLMSLNPHLGKRSDPVRTLDVLGLQVLDIGAAR